MTTMVLATHNQHKIGELQEILADYPFAFKSLRDFVDSDAPDETGTNYIENALIKARAACQQTGCLALADDSGLEVFALDGEPGLHSARFGGVESTASQKIELLLKRLAEQGGTDRSARFRCAMALVHPDGREWISDESCYGQIANSGSGAQGFGYDPVFFLPEFNKTMAELSSATKNVISHRSRSVHALFQEISKATDYPGLGH
jgi:XTP/dITP diphosphohydrolase